MFLFFIKIYRTLRRAIAGRRYPHQLAWAVAFGMLLGIVPHGNLLAVAILLIILSLRINHAMMGLTALATSFLAVKLDPVSHAMGDWVLSQDRVATLGRTAWSWPLVPWTDLNNTVVLGSAMIGTAALIPTFLITYPLFRLIAPERIDDETDHDDVIIERRADEDRRIFAVDPPHATPMPKARPVAPPTGQPAGIDLAATKPTPDPIERTESGLSVNEHRDVEFVEIHPPHTAAAPVQPDVPDPQVEPARSAAVGDSPVATTQTRIDVVRMEPVHGDPADASPAGPSPTPGTPSPPGSDQRSMDEALNYLLRQLRDSGTSDNPPVNAFSAAKPKSRSAA